MYFLLDTFWFLRTLKYVLFWLYLWQLKEYHVGRFLDHFRTQKGRGLVFNPLLALKIVLFFFSGFSNFFVAVLTLIYVAETGLFFWQIGKRTFKKPAQTAKISFLIIVCVAFLVVLLGLTLDINPVRLLAYDILLPVIISVIVLFFQPFFVLARNFYLKKASEKIKKFKNLKIIAITGSYGKTSTKEFLTTILSEKFKVLATEKHQNAEIGIAKCVLNDLGPSHQIFIAEMGAYNKGKVKQVCQMLKPSIGIVTGVNEQHLSLFGSMENLLLAEGGGELAQFLEKSGLLVVNGDNKYCLDLIKKFNGKEKIYAEKRGVINADIWADNVSVSKDSIDFMAIDKIGNAAHFKAEVLGGHNVQNLLGAILVAHELGMSFGEIVEATKNIKQEQAGMVLKKGVHGIDIVDSSYSANPDGVLADLGYLSTFPRKKIIIMPSLIELGKKSSEIHEKIGRKIGHVCDMTIITTKDKFKEIKDGAIAAGMAEKQIILCDKPQDIFSLITLFAKVGDAVLLEGRVPSQLINLLTK